jgi:hypothetical protein
MKSRSLGLVAILAALAVLIVASPVLAKERVVQLSLPDCS